MSITYAQINIDPVPLAVHADANAFGVQNRGKFPSVNWLPWPVLKISGTPYRRRAPSREPRCRNRLSSEIYG